VRTCLCNYASALDGTLTILKCPLIPEACKALRSALMRRDDTLADSILQVFAAIASHSVGQRQLLRMPGAPPFLELAVEHLDVQRMPLSSTAAFLLLRNLAFLPDNKAYFMADPRSVLLHAKRVHTFCPAILSPICHTIPMWMMQDYKTAG
jgi:hypothetical protein